MGVHRKLPIHGQPTRIADLDLFTSLNVQPIALLTLCHSKFIKYIEKKAATAKRDSRSGQNVVIMSIAI